MEAVIITGMSGAGRSRAADWFEDQGYYCVDNMPPALIDRFLEMAEADADRIDKVAFVADLRGGAFFGSLPGTIEELRGRPGIDLTVLYMEADPKDIVRRYNEVRRNHPLTGAAASIEVIEQEKAMLADVRRMADFILDTTNLKVAEMNAELGRMIFGGSGGSTFAVNIMSFGFKYGIPQESDIMFDVRFLPNPYWVQSLRKLSGNSKRVASYVFRNGMADSFIDGIHDLLKDMIPGYISEGKYHLNIAFGCTGGHHRSVAVANAAAERFAEDGLRVRVTHRDLDLQNRK